MKIRKSYPTKYSIRFLVFIVLSLFIFIFRIKKKIPAEVKKLKSPYLILGNHVGFWDPFVVGHLLPQFTHFVSSDAVFRSKILRFFLTSLGTIPKKKNIRDTKVIRDIVTVIRQGENVGLFPEAVRNWAGESFQIDKSIVKLIKLLKVPVVVAVLKGMNLFNPRWSTKLRFTRVEVEYKLLVSPPQIEELTEYQIFELLKEAIYHNELKYQRENLIRVRSKHKAEHISHALYVCPECLAIDSFRANQNDFKCQTCNYDIHIDKYFFFKRITDGKLYFNNMQEWYKWQENWMLQFVAEKFDNQYNQTIFQDIESKIYHSDSDADLSFIGIADLKLYIDRIEIVFKDKNEIIVMNFNDLQTINPQLNEKLEIFYNNEAYRAIGCRPGVSALKWEVAVNAIWKKMGLFNKLSAYIQNW